VRGFSVSATTFAGLPETQARRAKLTILKAMSEAAINFLIIFSRENFR
jgi:hypothetical protein